MMHVNIDEVERNIQAYLQRAESGEAFVITRNGKAVLELTRFGPKSRKKRPFGLCKGEFRVPDDFDDPLPDAILSDFEGK